MHDEFKDILIQNIKKKFKDNPIVLEIGENLKEKCNHEKITYISIYRRSLMEIIDVFGDFPILETHRLILRKFKLTDVDDLFEYASNKNIDKYVPWYAYTDKKEAIEFINCKIKLYNEGKLSSWAIELKEKHKVIGSIDFGKWDTKSNCASIGYALSCDYWNKGYATEALKEIIRFGFETMKLHRIQMEHVKENIASGKVMTKNGLKYEGLLRDAAYYKGIYYDKKIYSILEKEYMDLK